MAMSMTEYVETVYELVYAVVATSWRDTKNASDLMWSGPPTHSVGDHITPPLTTRVRLLSAV